ncbi:hypothetical protein [Kordiimonas aquimaris]|uniref:hypothetical protein n=1 Tax=Kordiimonas aquimaris TaxID=707591 RepID=UPI0021D3C0E9|nr:hypothetical protein [Kordiimonas aquimaris]
MSDPIIETIPAGGEFILSGQANYFYCYAATQELTFTIETSAGERTLPLDRGTGWQAPFEKVTVNNDTGSAQTVTIINLYIPELPVRGFFDDRELAAQVAVDGGIVTNTAPLTDQGGSIGGIGTSVRVYQPTGETADVVTAAANLNGVRIRDANMCLTAGAGNAPSYIAAGHDLIVWCNQHNLYERMRNEVHVPAGTAIAYSTPAGVTALIRINYDIL